MRSEIIGAGGLFARQLGRVSLADGKIDPTLSPELDQLP